MFWSKNKDSVIPSSEQEFLAITNAAAELAKNNFDSRLRSDAEKAKEAIPSYLHKYVETTHLEDFVRIRIPGHYDIYWSNGSFPFFVSHGAKSFHDFMKAVVFATKSREAK